MNQINPQIEESWKNLLINEFNSEYFQNLREFLIEEKKNNIVYPPGSLIFSAYNNTPFDKVKVVIIGQDPYHGEGQAHGLCFSVQKGIKPPPSLINIFKEIRNDLGYEIPSHGYLENWSIQGVLLLNATLTVRKDQAGSHQKKGWEQFTDATIKAISEKKQGIVFLLWGNFAIAKEALIDTSKHFVLKAAHPSPFSATRFMGCKHFSKTNELLKQQGKEEITWELD